MDIVKIAKPFVTATVDILSMMAQVQAVADKPYVKKSHTAAGDVSGIIGVTGMKRGIISVSFEKKCAIAIVKNMLGGEITDLLMDVQDAVGEISNMISGQARKGLSEMGMAFQAGTPTVIMGDNHSITHVGNGKVMAIPFHTEHGNFTIEISFED